MYESNIEFQTKNQSTVPSLVSTEEALSLLDPSYPLMEVVHRANQPREKYFGKKVRIHILDNIKNGHCPEDCGYCAQRKGANSGIQEYSLKSSDEIFENAKKAKEGGAYRYCMVTSGTGPSQKSTEALSMTIRKITKELGMKVCLSAGLLDQEKANLLKESGLDRYNHNLNTSESHYGEICTTHTYRDRVETLTALNQAGVGLCSGAIVGMGESTKDLVEIAFQLKALNVISIPINFFIPISGHAIPSPNPLSPEFCIRILSMFRMVNPDSEIRVAAGREGHLRSLQALSLYVANSLFASGYLNVKGSEVQSTIEMILDAGFEPELEGSEGNWISNTQHPYSTENIQNLYKFKKEPAREF